jgi:hypothetical protein
LVIGRVLTGRSLLWQHLRRLCKLPYSEVLCRCYRCA